MRMPHHLFIDVEVGGKDGGVLLTYAALEEGTLLLHEGTACVRGVSVRAGAVKVTTCPYSAPQVR